MLARLLLAAGLCAAPSAQEAEEAALERAREAPRPAPCPEEWRGLVGEYGAPGDSLRVLERGGRLFARVARSGEARELAFEGERELEGVDGSRYRLAGEGAAGERPELAFERDPEGRAVRATLGDAAWERRASELGGGPFRIEPRRPLAELRVEAERAAPPRETGKRPSDLVDLAAFPGLEGLVFDIRYATDDNFMGAAFYARAEAWAQRPAAEALARVQARLGERGFGLTVYDAFRPWRVTKMFWDATPEALRDFVADPARGSRHNRGCALDVTLHELATGRAVEMPSGYDEFSPRAHPAYDGGTSLQRWHRTLLVNAMEAEGFRVYAAEWWHFDLDGWEAYPILEDFP